MIFNAIHDFLCFQPSATLHETLKFLREKQGLKSLALQGTRKTEILVNFQKFHEKMLPETEKWSQNNVGYIKIPPKWCWKYQDVIKIMSDVNMP